MRYDIFLFDLDGLLIDSERIYKKAWQSAFERLQAPMPEEIFDSWRGKSAAAAAEDVVKIHHNIEIYHKAYEIREAFIAQALKNGQILQKKFASEALTKLREHGYMTGLVTSSPKNRVTAILEYFGWKDKINYAVTASDVKETKPSPVPYIHILELSNCRPNQAVAFEDSLTGYTAAAKSGIHTFLIPDRSFDIDENKIAGCQRAEDLSKVLELI